MTIKLFNTLTKKKENFIPVNLERVTMYVCGPTVYSYPHIGNARAAIVPDILFRLLNSKYKNVVYIRNITDVDDKIINAAKKEDLSPLEISQRYTDIYINNMNSLKILQPTHQPKVTEFMTSIVNMIEKIITSGYGYLNDKHVLFDTEKDNNYGCLSKKKLDEMIDGARVDVSDYKKSPRDFVLWKPSDEDDFGWDSPWGYGRPGWHIECTSMIKEIIGNDATLDIHGGGNDLIFPHHENEIAQGSCVSSKKYCNYWFHNGIVLVDKKKMSKSLGNVILLDDLLKRFNSDVIRIALLSAHYRQPLNWSDKTLINSKNLYKKVKSVELPDVNIGNNDFDIEIQDILSDDLNTPEALSYIAQLAKHSHKNSEDAIKLIKATNFIGLDIAKNESQLTNKTDLKNIENLIETRNEYRKNGDYKKADAVRDQLLSMGVELKDKDGITSWQYSSD